MVTVDLTKNPKQAEFFSAVMEEVRKYKEIQELRRQGVSYDHIESVLREFFYGGAIRGGKTFVCLTILVVLCKIFPGSRWHVVRATMSRLEETTIPSIKKIIGNSPHQWSNRAGDKYVQIFKNGKPAGRIYFMAEQYNIDKELNRFKGIETNGFLLEQLEELQRETYQKCKERAGSWYCDPMPPAFIFSTFNPTWNWLKKDIYEQHKKGKLPPYQYFLEASPRDNPYVTEDQWNQWNTLDKQFREQFIEGSWDMEMEGRFYSSFTTKRNTGPVRQKVGIDVWAAFDFNVDPMTCTLFQTDSETFFHIFKEFEMPDSNTPALCNEIMDYFDHKLPFLNVVGDASGLSRMSGTEGSVNHYQIIMSKLDLMPEQVLTPERNPGISDSRAFMNSIFEFFPSFLVNPDTCPKTVEDLLFVEKKITASGEVEIKKNGMNKWAGVSNEKLTHLSDTIRYGAHVALQDWFYNTTGGLYRS